MPSSHSQFIWFFSIYSLLFLYLRMHQTNNARCLDLLWRHILSVCLLTLAFLVSYSRVYLMYHSWSQVIYGVIAGGVMGATWFIFTQEVLTPLFPRIASWPISEFFLIRDTSLIPNILWFEYTVTRSEARNRQRKLGTKMQWCKISIFYLRARLVRISKERKINSNKNMSFENSLFFGRWSKASWDIRRQSRHPLWLQSVLI